MTAVADQPAARHKDTSSGPLLQTDKLVKIYGGRAVVNGVDINVRRGEVVGAFIG